MYTKAELKQIQDERFAKIRNFFCQYLNREVTEADLQRISPAPTNEDEEACSGGQTVYMRIPLKLVVIEKICEHIERHGLSIEGIFRVPGGAYAVRALWATFDYLERGDEVDFSQVRNVHNVAGALKIYLLEQDQPLIPFHLYSELIAATKDSSDAETAAALKRIIVDSIPPQRKKMLHRLFLLMVNLLKATEDNKMTLRNLGIVFSPLLVRSKADSLAEASRDSAAKIRMLEVGIDRFDEVFPEPFVGSYVETPNLAAVPNLTERDWRILLGKAKVLQFKEGDVIVAEEQRNTHFYRIKRGTCMVKKRKADWVVNLIALDIFGDISMLDCNMFASANVTVTSTTAVVWSVPVSYIRPILHIDPRLAFKFYANVCAEMAMRVRLRMSEQTHGQRQVREVVGRQRSMTGFQSVSRNGDRGPPIMAVGTPTKAVAVKSKTDHNVHEAIRQFETKVKGKKGILYISDQGVAHFTRFLGVEKRRGVAFDTMLNVSSNISAEKLQRKTVASKKSSGKSYEVSITYKVKKMRNLKLLFCTEAEAVEAYNVISHIWQEISLMDGLRAEHRRSSQGVPAPADGMPRRSAGVPVTPKKGSSKKESADSDATDTTFDDMSTDGDLSMHAARKPLKKTVFHRLVATRQWDAAVASELPPALRREAEEDITQVRRALRFDVGDVMEVHSERRKGNLVWAKLVGCSNAKGKGDMADAGAVSGGAQRGTAATASKLDADADELDFEDDEDSTGDDGLPRGWVRLACVEELSTPNLMLPGLPTADDWIAILSIGKTVRHVKETVIVTEGTRTENLLYKIVKGVVRLERKVATSVAADDAQVESKSATVGMCGPDEILGETVFLLGGVAGESIVAHSPEVEMIVIHGSTLQKIFDIRGDLAGSFFKHIASCLEKRLRRLETTQ